MKKRINWIIAIALSVFLYNCNEDDHNYDNYFSALGIIDTATTTTTDYLIYLDQETDPVLIPVEIHEYNYVPKHGDRVAVVFTLTDRNDITEATAEAIIHDLDKITLKDAVAYNDSIADELGDDKVSLAKSTLWQNDNLLNVIVGYWGAGYRSHTVNLVVPDSLETDSLGNYILDIYHNDNGDKGNYYFEGLISFDLNSLTGLIPGAENGISFVIRHQANNGEMKIVDREFSYPYTTGEDEYSGDLDDMKQSITLL